MNGLDKLYNWRYNKMQQITDSDRNQFIYIYLNNAFPLFSDF